MDKMKYIIIKGIHSCSSEQIIDYLKESRLVIIKNDKIIPEKELVDFYYSLGDPVIQDEEYMTDEYVNEYCAGYRELIPVRNREISGYGEPGLFSGDDSGEVLWHSEPQNRDTYDDIVAMQMKKFPISGGETVFADQQAMYQDLPNGFKNIIDDLQIDWTHRYSSRTEEYPINDENIPYNPWQKWDSKCYRRGKDDAVRGEGWNYLYMKDIDGKYLIDKEVKYKPLVIKNPISGIKGISFPNDTIFRFKDMSRNESKKIIDILEEETFREKYIYTHKWEKGDILLSDITHSLHKRNPYRGDRLMYRSCIYFKDNPYDPRKKYTL